MSIYEKNGVSLYYQVQGQGPAILFIHPPVLTSTCFMPEMEGLSKGHCTILFDIRGHGKSNASREPITFTLIAEDIRKLIDHLKIQKVFLCGYSMGGCVALEFVLRYPERVIGSVLVGSFSEVNDLWLKSRISVGAAFSNGGTFQALALGLAASHAHSMKLFYDTFKNSMKCDIQNARQYYQDGLQFNCTNRLSEITSPVLLVFGQKDKRFHAYGKLMKRNLANSALVFVPDAGHRIPVFFSKDLNAVISAFVRKCVC